LSIVFRRSGVMAALIVATTVKVGWTASGTESASFLDIPVGGAPSALGSAYTSQADDVYAPVWNPAGLGFLEGAELTGTHLSYIGPVYYEHAGFVVPLGKDEDSGTHNSGFGGAIQYLGTNNIDSRDESGASLGSFTASFAAYSLAYGHKVGENFSVGATAKYITEKILDATANAYAADLGVRYKPDSKLNLGAALANMGTKIKFVDQSDSLPMAGRLGATYQLYPQWDISAEGVYRKTGLMSGGAGVEWRYGDLFTFRGGYNTAHTKELGTMSGITAGVGIFFWGQEFSYAWLPIGDLGMTHYFSLVFRLSSHDRPERPRLKSAEERDFSDFNTTDPSQYHEIFDILSDDERKSIK
jgi:hypothetical protein